MAIASKGTGLEVNSDISQCMIISRDQNTGEKLNFNIDNISLEEVEQFKYLGTNLTNQNSIQEEIKSKLKSGNDCYHQVQNHLSSSFLSKSIKKMIYGTQL